MGSPQQMDFLAEAREHLTDVCDQLLQLERATGQDARQCIEKMLRAVHSIKGSAGFFGLRTIEQLSHRMESVLEAALERTVAKAGSVDAMLAAVDRLAALLDDLDGSHSANIEDVLARLDALMEDGSESQPPADDAPADEAKSPLPEISSPAVSPDHEFEIAVDLSHCQASGLPPLEIVTRASSHGTIVRGSISFTPVDLATSPPGGPVVWHATMASPLDDRTFMERLAIPSPPAQDARKPTTSRTPAPPPPPASTTSATIRIPVGLVDRLMNLAGELVLVRNQSRRFTDQDQPLPGQVVQRLDAVTSEFQETVLQTRMQPIGNLFNKFPRLVRDLSRQLGKQIELQVSGADVELDKTILDALSDPLTHLVRNACDHGIETTEERIRTGKPAAGTLRLSASHFGDQIWITIEDDGRGIDRERVRKKALEQGLRTLEELNKLDDHDLHSLILMPGFSTAAAVTDVSGRGVGLDVVKTNLARLGGGIDIQSPPGAGTTFILRLPLTLAIIPTLLVTSDGQRFAIPQKDLEELVFLDSEENTARVERTPSGEVVRLRGRLLPMVRLGRVLRGDFTTSAGPRENLDARFLAVVRAGSRRFGLVIDGILTSEEIVVKPMHSSLRRLTMYSGATVLGDGQVALILNTDGIALRARIKFHGDSDESATVQEGHVSGRRSVLLANQLNDEPIAVPLECVQRIVMVKPEQLERLSGDSLVSIDQLPTKLLAPIGALQLSPIDQPLFVILPRHASRPIGFVVKEIVGTEEVPQDAFHSIHDDGKSRLSAVIAGRITPLVDLSPHLVESPPASGSSQARHGDRTCRVLVVDDTQFFRDVVNRHLADEGYDVTTAEHGQAALALLAGEPFDIVVSDLEMPVMDGWALAAAIRKDPNQRHLPLLALTTLSGPDAESKSLAAGFDAHVVKLEPATLFAAIEKVLKSRAVPGAEEQPHA